MPVKSEKTFNTGIVEASFEVMSLNIGTLNIAILEHVSH